MHPHQHLLPPTSTPLHTPWMIMQRGIQKVHPGRFELAVIGMLYSIDIPLFLTIVRSCFNAFSRVDVRVDVKIPGGVNAYVMDLRGER